MKEPNKSLAEMFAQIPVRVIQPAVIPDVRVNQIVLDSRQVKPGTVFVALVGGNTDGHRYIPAAVERGAAAIIGTKPLEESIPVPYIQVAAARPAMAYLAAALYDFPAHSLTVIGVTGTDGKTTTSNLIYKILLSAGIKAGMISTVNAVIGEAELDTGFHVTTPEAPDVQRYLAMMRDAGLTHVVLESTSHGLAQDRVTACEYDFGVVTNITHEHLDYHGSYEAYREAKARLFDFLEETPFKPQGNHRLAVLNLDDQSYAYLNERIHGKKVTYSLTPAGDVYARDIHFGADGIRFTLVAGEQKFEVQSPLMGGFNVSNILAAISLALKGLHIAPEAVCQGIMAIQAIPGRMEVINLGQKFIAMVDFAHTPNALRRALEAARQMTRGRVIAVFGSAGLRDREKRRMMAEVSAELADLSILTAEDPRTEDLGGILQIMANAAASRGGIEGQTFFRIPDRGDAIRRAIALAQPGDLVIACGKGHEQSMCFGDVEYPWDDRVAMRAALAEFLGIPGEKMPYLPTQG